MQRYSEIKELFYPEEKFRSIRNFLRENIGLSEEELMGLFREAEERGNYFLSGINSLKKTTTPEGNTVWVVEINAKYYPPNLLAWPGAANKNESCNCVFLNRDFSEQAKRTILNHEIYHIDHLDWVRKLSQRMPALKFLLKQTHEVETIFMANLSKDPLASARVPLDYLLTTPELLIAFIQHFRNQFKDVGIISE